ncbi:hypothetical protein [Sphingomonas sp.]|uniref:hypothetical protein n=1 Tax=Sphingomonas sp. TaxID=28214 RepID=UPI001B1D17AB|nr:hypothetical protein [Sphingomonas sp.]MBO9714899.1 hypothetical protein [Sphingomonas sp.]
MKVPPLAVGVGGGLLLVLLLAPATGSALGSLAAARADEAKATAAAAQRPPGPLVAQGLGAGDDPDLLAERIRRRAHDAGVLIEQLRASAGEGGLVRVHLAVSGSEKAVVALADGVERDAVLLRFTRWEITPAQGGSVRLTGDAVAAKR